MANADKLATKSRLASWGLQVSTLYVPSALGILKPETIYLSCAKVADPSLLVYILLRQFFLVFYADFFKTLIKTLYFEISFLNKHCILNVVSTSTVLNVFYI